MKAVNVTIRVDEETKREFDKFCENVGMNITTAFNLFMRAVLRTRKLPFPITDAEPVKRSGSREQLRDVFRAAQAQSIINGTDNMTMEEVNEEIAAYRREKRGQ